MRSSAAIAILALAPLVSLGDQPSATGFQSRTFKSPDGSEVKYSVFVPKSYAAGKATPTILFLHGAGETGTDGLKQTQVGLGPAVRQREATFPFLVVFPQAQEVEKLLIGTWMAGHKEGDRALAILDAVKKEFTVDDHRTYLSGVSMGGFGTWSIAQKYPNKWAAIAPVCGGGDNGNAGVIKNIPCWCFHGAADPTVTVELSRTMIDALKKAGGSPKYDEYPGVGHNSWDKAYGTDGLYEWMLKQSLKK